MVIRVFEADEDPLEGVSNEEEVCHSHQTPNESIVVTRMLDPEDDPDYDGEPMGCPACGAEVDYFTCNDCGKTFPTKKALAGHMSSHSEDNE